MAKSYLRREWLIGNATLICTAGLVIAGTWEGPEESYRWPVGITLSPLPSWWALGVGIAAFAFAFVMVLGALVERWRQPALVQKSLSVKSWGNIGPPTAGAWRPLVQKDVL